MLHIAFPSFIFYRARVLDGNYDLRFTWQSHPDGKRQQLEMFTDTHLPQTIRLSTPAASPPRANSETGIGTFRGLIYGGMIVAPFWLAVVLAISGSA